MDGMVILIAEIYESNPYSFALIRLKYSVSVQTAIKVNQSGFVDGTSGFSFPRQASTRY
jgi:hypothetical protein